MPAAQKGGFRAARPTRWRQLVKTNRTVFLAKLGRPAAGKTCVGGNHALVDRLEMPPGSFASLPVNPALNQEIRSYKSVYYVHEIVCSMRPHLGRVKPISDALNGSSDCKRLVVALQEAQHLRYDRFSCRLSQPRLAPPSGKDSDLSIPETKQHGDTVVARGCSDPPMIHQQSGRGDSVVLVQKPDRLGEYKEGNLEPLLSLTARELCCLANIQKSTFDEFKGLGINAFSDVNQWTLRGDGDNILTPCILLASGMPDEPH
mmetsp:Transcript_17342/g.25971  ORF Transcript_17342/g.25971 Transcript_17342/m.25971 type:complete len:260 (-) Transcript_17342:3-782(-)